MRASDVNHSVVAPRAFTYYSTALLTITNRLADYPIRSDSQLIRRL